MLNPIDSFDELSLKVVAVRAANNSDFGFEFPAVSRLMSVLAIAAPLKQPKKPRGDPPAQRDTWHHGGLNE